MADGYQDDIEEFNSGGVGAKDFVAEEIDFDQNMTSYATVKDCCFLMRSHRLADFFRKFNDFTSEDAPQKNAIPKDDPEREFLAETSNLALTIEMEKTKVHKFLRDHYARRFPELSMLILDSFTYAKVVLLVKNTMDLTGLIDDLDELLPSQTTACIVCAAGTTQGRDLEPAEMGAVIEAAEELVKLEEVKQIFLEYIQTRMPLVSPNLCRFLGTGIVSQMFALAGSIENIANMDANEVAKLGSSKKSFGGFKAESAGFLINAPLVSCHPPELRAKALRLVSQVVCTLARVDDNKRASDDSQGEKAYEDIKRKMLQWTDPLIKRQGHNTYERQGRKRNRDAMPEGSMKQRKGLSRHFKRV